MEMHVTYLEEISSPGIYHPWFSFDEPQNSERIATINPEKDRLVGSQKFDFPDDKLQKVQSAVCAFLSGNKGKPFDDEFVSGIERVVVKVCEEYKPLLPQITRSRRADMA